MRHGFVERAEDWEWGSFRTTARLAPPPRRHLACGPFENLLHLEGTSERLDIMRAFVRENDVEPR